MNETAPPARPSLVERWTTTPAERSASGGTSASPLGQWAWAWFEGARNPHVLLITSYICAPYFYLQLVGDPVKGQPLCGDLNSLAGLIIAVIAPMLGAVADAGGRRKPWLAAFSISLAVTAGLLWFAMPNEAGLSLAVTCVLLVATIVSFDFTAVFHNAMLPAIAPDNRVGRLSGLALALGNLSGVILFVFMLVCFVFHAIDYFSYKLSIQYTDQYSILNTNCRIRYF